MSARDEVKARVRAMIAAQEALPAAERIANTLHATHTHAEAEQLLAEVRADAFREAETALHEMWAMAPASAKGPGINFAIGVLRALRDATGEKTTAPMAAAVTPPPEDTAALVAADDGTGGDYQRAAVIRDRIDALLDHIRRHPGRTWTTSAVHAFYASRAPKRATARRDLETLHCLGWLTLHDDEGRRSYTYTTRKDSAR